MRRFVWLMTLLLTLGVTESVRADETITVSSTSSEIASGLDLKAVAKIFAASKDLEEFEAVLNNPDSSFVNLDLNGDGDIDYIRVVETGSGNSRLIVLQAILAKDIFQDIASIRVVKDEAQKVQVTITGDEEIYGTNYVITPVYIYRPVIYDWFWGPHWYCWHSPYYWGYWPGWWHPVHCWEHDWYAHRIYTYHHAHPYCSYHTSREVRQTARAASPSATSRTRYATQSSYVPNQTTYAARAAATTNTGQSVRQAQQSTRQAQQSTRQAQQSTRQAQSDTRTAVSTSRTTGTSVRNASTPVRTSSSRAQTSNYTRSSSSYSTPSSSSSTRSAGSYGGSSVRSAGGYSGGGFSGGSVRSSGGSMRR